MRAKLFCLPKRDVARNVRSLHELLIVCFRLPDLLGAGCDFGLFLSQPICFGCIENVLLNHLFKREPMSDELFYSFFQPPFVSE